MNKPTLSVIITTYNRAESLRMTLACLAAAYRPDLPAEVIVVDNGSTDHTRQVVEEFRGRFTLKWLEETVVGKGACLNRAIESGPLGELVAVLDNDMSPDASWFEGVSAISTRRPDCDYFGGDIHVIWPEGPLPAWTQAPAIQGWAYSAFNRGSNADQPIQTGNWLCGGNFWFRSRVLQNGLRFENVWLAEARFILQLQERGARGIADPDARAGHRIQPQLLRRDVLLERAKKVGAGFAELRMRSGTITKQGRLLRRNPLLFYAVCTTGLLYWSCVRVLAHARLSPLRFAHILHATERATAYLTFLRMALGEQAKD